MAKEKEKVRVVQVSEEVYNKLLQAQIKVEEESGFKIKIASLTNKALMLGIAGLQS